MLENFTLISYLIVKWIKFWHFIHANAYILKSKRTVISITCTFSLKKNVIIEVHVDKGPKGAISEKEQWSFLNKNHYTF